MFEEAGIDVPDAVVGRAHDGIDKTVEASLFTSYIELKCMVQIKIWEKELKFILTSPKEGASSFKMPIA